MDNVSLPDDVPLYNIIFFGCKKSIKVLPFQLLNAVSLIR